MNEEALKELLNGHLKYVALIVTGINAVAFMANLIFAELLKRKFKAFENKLDSLASRDEARFTYQFSKAADAANGLIDSCMELRARLDALLTMSTITSQGDNPSHIAEIRTISRHSYDQYEHAYRIYLNSRRYFTTGVETSARAMLDLSINIILLINPDDIPTDIAIIKEASKKLEETYEGLENGFKLFIGNLE